MTRWGRLSGAVATFACLAVLLPCAAPRAQAVVYWGSETAFGAANLDGSVPVFSYPYEIRGMVPRASICGLAVSGTYLYWADRRNGAIGRLGLPPSTTGQARRDIFKEPLPLNESLVGGLAEPCGVAVDASHLYWADTGGLSIGRANLDGSGVEPDFIVGASNPCGVAVDGGHVYWGNRASNSIGRANLAGGEVEQDFITGADWPCGVAVNSSHVYWANELGRSIGRANLAGGEVEQSFLAEAGYTCGVAVDQAHVYWSTDFGTQGVGRARLDGGEINRDLVPSQYGYTCGVAVDSRVFDPPPPPLSRRFFLGRGVRSRHPVSMTYPVKVPATGIGIRLAVIAKGLSWHVLRPEPPVQEGGYLVWQLKVWPAKEGRAAHRIRNALRHKGHVSMTLIVEYEEDGKSPATETRALTLVGRRGGAGGRR